MDHSVRTTDINPSYSGPIGTLRHSGKPHRRPGGGHGVEGKTGECGFNEEKMGVELNDDGKLGVTRNVALPPRAVCP